MKILLLCVLFAPIIFMAFRQKKWYLYLAIAFAGILPETFAIEFHEALPLLSGSRILILLVSAFAAIDMWKQRKLFLPRSLLVYLVVNIVISLVNLRFGTDDIRRIFLLIFERGLFMIAIASLIKSKEEFHLCVDFFILGSVAVAIIGMVQTVFDYDIASVLQLVEERSATTLTHRMGLTRAYGTFNAISYGCYCCFSILIALYKLYNTNRQRYTLAFSLNTVALILTFSRSAWLALIAVLALLFLVQGLRFIKKLLPSVACILAILLLLQCFQPRLYLALSETCKTTVNTALSLFLPESSEDPDNEEPDLGFDISDEFGLNAEAPAYSRLVQLSSLEYMFKEGHGLFGYGYNAFMKGKLHYNYGDWGWITATTLDVGFLFVATESGMLGLLCLLGLLGYFAVVALRKKEKRESFTFYRLILFMIPLYCLLNFMAAFLYAIAIWQLFGLYYAYRKLDKAQLLTEEHPALEKKWVF